jgi:hypothetical protein
MRRFSLVILIALAAGSAIGAFAADPEPSAPAAPVDPPLSFRNDVMPILSKAGCNAGACHGNKSGKGGFKLSLRGENPIADYDALARDVYARRIDPFDPDRSLILLKATAQIAHEGNRRFTADSPEYTILRQWIDAGAPRDSENSPKLVKLEVTPTERVLVEPVNEVRIRATATFSDGSTRDVSRMAVYEQSQQLADISIDGVVTKKKLGGPAVGEPAVGRPAVGEPAVGETSIAVRFLNRQTVVRLAFVPARPEFAWSNPKPKNVVDEQIFAKLKTLRMNPSELCGDELFVRRAYLDLLGLLPTAEEARAFVADKSADKRTKLIDSLLQRPEYADFWAIKWADLLRVEERTLDKTGVEAFHGWIRKAIADNMPIDAFSRALVTGTGSTYKNPTANYYRALRDPVTRGEAAAQVFLGTRLQCAQCHNHPFDRWTQDDYFQWADVFSRIDYQIVENKRKDKNDGHEFIGEQIVLVKESGEMKDPRTGGDVSRAKLLGDKQPLAASQNRLDALGEWLTAPSNRLFARAQVNRIWAQIMGRGLVDPVDDFRATNPATHPKLLELLTDDFIANGYDARRLIRLIMTSATYQLASEANETNRGDEINYSHAIPRRLQAEQLTDALHQVAAVAPEFAGYPKGTRARQIRGVQAVSRREGGRPTMADQFLIGFGKPPRQLSCDCERANETALGQAFQLVSGPLIAQLIAEKGNRIDQLIDSSKSDDQIIEALYWTALGRAPDANERKGMADHIVAGKDRRKAFEDVMWALMNAKELVLRR